MGPWDDHGMGIGPWDDYGRHPLAVTDRDPLLAGLGHSIQTVQQYKQRAEVSDRQDLREQVSRVRFARDPLDREEFAVTKVAEEARGTHDMLGLLESNGVQERRNSFAKFTLFYGIYDI